MSSRGCLTALSRHDEQNAGIWEIDHAGNEGGPTEMTRTWCFAWAAGIVLLALTPRPGLAAEWENRPMVGLFDTLALLGEDAACAGLQARNGWREVDGMEHDYRIQSDAATSLAAREARVWTNTLTKRRR